MIDISDKLLNLLMVIMVEFSSVLKWMVLITLILLILQTNLFLALRGLLPVECWEIFSELRILHFYVRRVVKRDLESRKLFTHILSKNDFIETIVMRLQDERVLYQEAFWLHLDVWSSCSIVELLVLNQYFLFIIQVSEIMREVDSSIVSWLPIHLLFLIPASNLRYDVLVLEILSIFNTLDNQWRALNPFRCNFNTGF